MIEKKKQIRTMVQRKSKKTCLDGSLTVEAAFIMPIIVYTIFALIYLAFYLHDNCRIQGIVDKTLYKAGIIMKHEADIETGAIAYEDINDRGIFYLLIENTEEEEKIQRYLQQELSKGLFLSKVTAMHADVVRNMLTITVETETKVSLPGVKQLFRELSHREIIEEYGVHNPADTIRRCEVILDTGSDIKGVDKLKKKLINIFNLK